MLWQLTYQVNPENQWMAPYAFAIVGLGFLLFIIHVILGALQRKNDFLWYRQVFSYKRLSLSRKRYLESFSFYNKLSLSYQRQYEHRMCCFIADKKFEHRHKKPVTDEQIVLVAAVACQLSFGRRDYLFPFLDTILFFDEEFKSPTNSEYHKGEYNPRARVLALSWVDFKQGMDVSNDNIHLGLHEFTHVMHLESERYASIDAYRYHKYHQRILHKLMDNDVKNKLTTTSFFRMYAFTNQYEFMAVLTEYFFESPHDFKTHFPELFMFLKTALLYKEEWL